MKFRVELVCLNDGGEQRCSVMELERAELAIETLGLSVAEGKTMLHGSVAKTVWRWFDTLERCPSPRLSHSNGATIPAR